MDECIGLSHDIICFPFSKLKKIEPLLKECFGYSRALIANELNNFTALLMTKPEFISDSKLDINKYKSYTRKDGTPIADNESKENATAWTNYEEFAMDSDYYLSFKATIFKSQKLKRESEERQWYTMTPKAEEATENDIDVWFALQFMNILCYKYMKGEINRDECTLVPDTCTIKNPIDNTDILEIKGNKGEAIKLNPGEEYDITEGIRMHNYINMEEDMLNLYAYLKQNESPLTIRAKNAGRPLKLKYSPSWLIKLLEQALKMNSSKEAEKAVTATQKEQDRIQQLTSVSFPLYNIMVYGTYKLLQYSSSLASLKEKPTKILEDQCKLIKFYIQQLKIPTTIAISADDMEDIQLISTFLNERQHKNFQPDFHSLVLGSPIRFFPEQLQS